MISSGFLNYARAALGVFTTGFIASTLSGPTLFSDSTQQDEHTTKHEDNEDESTMNNTYQLVGQWLKWTGITDGQSDIDPKKETTGVFINEVRMKEHYDAPKYPVVLCHGLSGFDKLMLVPSLQYLAGLAKDGQGARREFLAHDKNGVALEYWFGIKEALEEKGTTVLVARVPGFGSIEDRATHLNRYITREVDFLRRQSVDDIYNEEGQSKKSFKQKDEKMKVNLIAHSMGGLDARYLISQMEKQNYEVVSLTTVTTPHRGSEIADYVVSLSKKLPHRVKLPPSMYQLTTRYMAKFNDEVKDDPKVEYFSYGAAFKPSWYNVFYYSWSIINGKAGDNDGMRTLD
ncbi:Lipase 2 [Cyberlindnera fabianii]|uniref:Lipase 2 n=1 Tax=Cyberlindnera fabianii TaxID=36022 RepID=A0A1V2L648_CYBFA|nr:Lipase 2 [Cyberlindnera fabianii]